MGPPHLALSLLVEQGLYGRLESEAMVGQLGVIEDQPIGQFAVEGGQVGEQQVFMEVHEAFLDGAVEAFGVCVHFGAFRVSPPVGNGALLEGLCKPPVELGAVVGADEARWHGQQLAQSLQGDGGLLAGGASGGQGVSAPEVAYFQPILGRFKGCFHAMPYGLAGQPMEAFDPVSEVRYLHCLPPGDSSIGF